MLDNGLSERECEILRLVATGASNKEIALKLSISANTVKVHLRNIFAKIGVASRTEATVYAIRAGLVLIDGAAPAEPASGTQPASEELAQASVALPGQPALSARLRQSWPLAAAVGVALVLLVSLAVVIRQPSITASASPAAPPAPPRWQARSPLPSRRSSQAAAFYENQIYVIGGQTSRGVSGIVQRYDPTSDNWASLSTKPVAVTDVSAATVGGRIYVPGGRLDSENSKVSDLLEVYDPRQDRWEERAKLPEPRSAYALAALEGKIYLFGGWDGKEYVKTVYEYDPDTDVWQTRKSMSEPRGFAGTAAVGGKIYVIGGYDGTNALAQSEIYQPDRDTESDTPWTEGTPLPVARYAMGMTSLSDTIYVIGGMGPAGKELPPLGYSEKDDKWTPFESPFPQDWTHMSVVSEGMYIYGIGGTKESVLVSSNMRYQAMYTVILPTLH